MNPDGPLAVLFPDKAKPILPVVAYEDIRAREHAIRVFKQMVPQLNGAWEFDYSWWRFDYLKDATLADLAASDAIQADVVIVAANPEGDFPEALTEWIESWASRKTNLPSALVGLLGEADDPRRLTSPRHASLRAYANLARMDYLPCHPPGTSAPCAQRDSPFPETQRRVETVTPVMETILHHRPPPRGWGINE